MKNPVQVVHNYLNLMNELRSEIDVSKSICKSTSTESILQSTNLILALVDKMNIDLVPESNVDETITDIQGLFVSYMRNRTKENLELLLSTIRKMLSELYVTCDSDEKEIFKKHLETLQNITQPNII